MRDFSFSGYGFLPFGKRDIVERELSLKDQLIERLERRFKEHQASLRFITVGSLAMALSACKDDALVQGPDGDDILGNTVEDQIFKGRLGNDVYSYLMSGTDTITDTANYTIRVVHVTSISWDYVNVDVWDSLSTDLTTINTNIISIWLVLLI